MHCSGGLGFLQTAVGLVVQLAGAAVVGQRFRLQLVRQLLDLELGELLAEDGDVLVDQPAQLPVLVPLGQASFLACAQPPHRLTVGAIAPVQSNSRGS